MMCLFKYKFLKKFKLFLLVTHFESNEKIIQEKQLIVTFWRHIIFGVHFVGKLVHLLLDTLVAWLDLDCVVCRLDGICDHPDQILCHYQFFLYDLNLAQLDRLASTLYLHIRPFLFILMLIELPYQPEQTHIKFIHHSRSGLEGLHQNNHRKRWVHICQELNVLNLDASHILATHEQTHWRSQIVLEHFVLLAVFSLCVVEDL